MLFSVTGTKLKQLVRLLNGPSAIIFPVNADSDFWLNVRKSNTLSSSDVSTEIPGVIF